VHSLQFLILCCDGVWDALSNDDAAAFVAQAWGGLRAGDTRLLRHSQAATGMAAAAAATAVEGGGGSSGGGGIGFGGGLAAALAAATTSSAPPPLASVAPAAIPWDPKEAAAHVAEALADEALARGSRDNITALVVAFPAVMQ
jgi:serine/threonine protein phosphatase PrpC